MNNNHYILLGGAEHFDFFSNNLAFADEDWFWTVPKTAKIGEKCFVYLCAPVSRLVGQLEIIDEPFYNTHLFPEWANKWMAKVKFVEYFEERPELTIKGLRQLFPDWAWLRYPRGKVRIPAHILTPFLELMGD